MMSAPIQKKEIEMCLCSRCASIFYASREYRIERCEVYQLIHEPCQICLNPYGYDFRINVRNPIRTRKCTFEIGGSEKVQSRQRGGMQ